MENQQGPFLPESVDEQLDQLSWHTQAKPLNPETELVHNLYNTYQEDLRTRDRVWQNLNQLASQHRLDIQKQPAKRTKSYERFHYMHYNERPNQAGTRRMALIASVIFTVLLVGSLAWVLNMAQHSTTGSQHSTPVNTPTPTPYPNIPTPTPYPNIPTPTPYPNNPTPTPYPNNPTPTPYPNDPTPTTYPNNPTPTPPYPNQNRVPTPTPPYPDNHPTPTPGNPNGAPTPTPIPAPRQ